MYCSLPTTDLNNESVELDRTLSSHRADSNSSVPSKASSQPLRAAQLNNVQAFVNVLGSRFHGESSAVAIVYTSVLESQGKLLLSCTCPRK